ncbi:MAG: hypothetical protein CVU56_17950 [Deltaproteobacteria bacterium HGW-Deltaproteobacteria-14]|jgi:DNA mismatch repair protein MutS2|nr:MAG: hypothetical protein CVU56_17950 [Deltaproteobacteria bacterium HGW-Deltaproteobacteria-14]
MFNVTESCLRDLGWSRVVRALAERTTTDPGRAAAEALAFFAEVEDIERCYDQVDALMDHLLAGGRIPLQGTSDVRSSLALAKRGGILDVEELLAVTDTARAAAHAKRSLLERAPALAALGEAMPQLASLAHELAATFDKAGNIKDDASPELAAARRRLIGLHRQAKERLDAYLARADIQEVLQDEYYTQREDRYVVPVVASFQSQIPGIIHGTSNSGQTVFVEPSEFIEINNHVKVAESAVEIATRQVLRERTQWVAAEADDLEMALASLVTLDVLQARAQLGLDLDAHRPKVARDGVIRLQKARNPHLLLKGSQVVPNDVLVEAHHAFVVITGPNTGGKTVTLNTLGAFALMVRAGIPIPAGPDSALPVFDGVFALIGDAQDIERDLSTFSGHLLAIQRVLDVAHAGALVLLDEIIVGTEPTQGAALAIAVLEALADRGARGLVTTHYERLKTLAFEDPRFGNASVGIDAHTLAPNFVLTSGTPGSSSPFEIAARLGMNDGVLARARAIAGGDEGIAEAIRRLSEARQAAERAAHEATMAKQLAERRAAELEAERVALRQRSQAEMNRINKDIRDASRAFLDALREKTADIQRTNDPREIARQRQEVLEVLEQLPEVPPEPGPSHLLKPKGAKGPSDGGALPSGAVVPGARVWIRPLDSAGEVVDVRGDKAMVAVGVFRTTVSLSELGKVVGDAPAQESPKKTIAVLRVEGVAQQIAEDDPSVPVPQNSANTADIRGMRRDEVEELVMPLLDRAFRENLGTVWVIHGHGTGVLKDEVRRLIRESPYVSKWRPGVRHEGGDGVTIAWLASY